MKRLMPVALIVLLLASAGLAGLWYQYQQFLIAPLHIEKSGLVIMVEPGANIRSVLAKLEQLGATRTDWRWRLLGRLKPVTIKAGEYELKPGLSPPGLLDLLAAGKVVNYLFTIVEGWTVRQLLGAMVEDPVLQHTLTSVAELNDLAGLPADNPEGWFLPETYAFIRGDSDLQILKRAYADMSERDRKSVV